MKVSVEDQSMVKKVLHIEVPQEDVVRELDSAYQQLKKTAKIKGFRPGKAPRGVLERLYRKDVHADVSAKLIQNAFVEALKETNLNIVGSPKVDPPELSDQSAYAFDAEVEVHPEIADIDYKGLELTRNQYSVTDEEIDMQLKMLRTNMAKRQKIDEDRPAQAGDLVVIDYEGFQDGKPHEETRKTENFITKIGEGQVVKDLDEGLKGMKAGEEKEVEVQFPEDYFSKSLAGQKLVFKIKLHEIREEILPELNDEFARNVSDKFENLDALKAKIRENLEGGYAKRVEQELNEQIFRQLLDKVEFEVPETLVDAELDHILNEAQQKFVQNNRSFEDLGLSREKLADQYRPTAEKQVRRHMILSKLMDQEKLELTDEELDKGFQKMADNYQQPADFIKGYYDQNKEGLAFFKHTLLEKKALNLIINSNEIREIEAGQDRQAAESESETDVQS
jgi:trigger factor